MVQTITIVSFTTVMFGIVSLLLISKARKKLCDGSVKKYMDNFAVCLAFIVVFSVWQSVRSVFGVNINIEGIATYPEYIFIIFAYIAFNLASYRILKVSEEFGFKKEGEDIRQAINRRQKIKK